MRMNSIRRLSVTAIAASLLGCAIVGCGGPAGPEGMPELFPTVLTITQGGTPLEGASVQMVPSDPSLTKWSCGGASDAMGKVVVMTLGKYPGAAAGSYKVTVFKELMETAGPANADPASSSTTKAFALVDPKFQLADTTPASVTVTSGENTPPAIDLGAPVKIAAPNL
jgi:hypothetical protein